jgi:hypothetical protein
MKLYLVESDYTVVFFAAGSRHTPGWNWVWKAYRSLSRKYRKNLKRLVSPHFLSASKGQCMFGCNPISPIRTTMGCTKGRLTQRINEALVAPVIAPSLCSALLFLGLLTIHSPLCIVYSSFQLFHEEFVSFHSWRPYVLC